MNSWGAENDTQSSVDTLSPSPPPCLEGKGRSIGILLAVANPALRVRCSLTAVARMYAGSLARCQTLRTVVEFDGNQRALVADIIEAISDVIRVHPRWANLGLAWLEAFDKINLASIRLAAKATGAAPLHSAVMVLLCTELERLLGPSKLPKPAKMPRVKREPKTPASLTRVPGAIGISISDSDCWRCAPPSNRTMLSAALSAGNSISMAGTLARS